MSTYRIAGTVRDISAVGPADPTPDTWTTFATAQDGTRFALPPGAEVLAVPDPLPLTAGALIEIQVGATWRPAWRLALPLNAPAQWADSKGQGLTDADVKALGWRLPA